MRGPGIRMFIWLRKVPRPLEIDRLTFSVAVAAGLLPYAYMPLASATNPPMNWGYTRTPRDSSSLTNRPQYPGSLSEVTVKSLGRLMGTTQPNAATEDSPRRTSGTTAAKRPALDWLLLEQLIKAFSIVGLIGYFASFLFVFRFPLPKRVWIYFLHLAFVLAAFFSP